MKRFALCFKLGHRGVLLTEGTESSERTMMRRTTQGKDGRGPGHMRRRGEKRKRRAKW